jgi:hypothetical protein
VLYDCTKLNIKNNIIRIIDEKGTTYTAYWNNLLKYFIDIQPFEIKFCKYEKDYNLDIRNKRLLLFHSFVGNKEEYWHTISSRHGFIFKELSLFMHVTTGEIFKKEYNIIDAMRINGRISIDYSIIKHNKYEMISIDKHNYWADDREKREQYKHHMSVCNTTNKW